MTNDELNEKARKFADMVDSSRISSSWRYSYHGYLIGFKAAFEILNGNILESSEEFCDCTDVDFMYTRGLVLRCAKCQRPISQNSTERT